MQADGKVIICGYFTNLSGQYADRIGRMSSDGTFDTSFNANVKVPRSPDYPHPSVHSVIEQADGRLLVAGAFTNIGGLARSYLARITPTGIADPGFNSVNLPSVYETVSCLAIQADGKILAGGLFTSFNGEARTNLVRLNSDGSLDKQFNPKISQGPSHPVWDRSGYPSVSCIAIQPDGKILIGGRFRHVQGMTNFALARLHENGSLDDGFNPNILWSWTPIGPIWQMISISVQANGKIIIGGTFQGVGGLAQTNLARLHPNGQVDEGFRPTFTGVDTFGVVAAQLQPDGKILVTGQFSSISGYPRNGVGRIINPDSSMDNLAYDGQSIAWMRWGGIPEVWRTTFEHSPDGNTWTSLGSGIRVAGGWLLDAPGLPIGNRLRGRGHIQKGGSSWYVEKIVSVTPVILSQAADFGQTPLGFGFSTLARPSRSTVIEGSVDLINWTPLATNIPGTSPFYWRQTNAVGLPHYFFRTKTP